MLTRDLFAVANLLVCYCVIWVVRGLGVGARCASVLLLIIQCVNYGSHILSFVVIAYNSFLYINPQLVIAVRQSHNHNYCY